MGKQVSSCSELLQITNGDFPLPPPGPKKKPNSRTNGPINLLTAGCPAPPGCQAARRKEEGEGACSVRRERGGGGGTKKTSHWDQCVTRSLERSKVGSFNYYFGKRRAVLIITRYRRSNLNCSFGVGGHVFSKKVGRALLGPKPWILDLLLILNSFDESFLIAHHYLEIPRPIAYL